MLAKITGILRHRGMSSEPSRHSPSPGTEPALDMNQKPPIFLDSKEASELLGISEASFLRLVHEGKIQITAHAPNREGKLYFLRADLLRLKKRNPGFWLLA